MTDILPAQTSLFPAPVAPLGRKSKVVMSPFRNSTGDPTVGELIDVIRTECILPETRRPMELHGYQLDLIEAWADPDTNVDVAAIAAGNAKTTTLGAFLTAHIMLTYETEVPIVADTVTQAVNTLWGRVKRFIELNVEMLARCEILEGQGSRRGVYVPGMGGHCFPIADKPSGLQGLNPTIAALEEMSEASIHTYGALTNRLGKRPASVLNKVVGISTPSFLPDNALISVQRAVHGARVGDVDTERINLIEHISDQTDHRDRTQWHKANPGLAVGVLQESAIISDLTLPEQRFRAYRLCQNPVGSDSCWLNSIDDNTGDELGDAYDIWKRAEQPYRLVDGAKTFVGVDVAKSRDHAAVVWGQWRDDGRLHARCKVWTPTKEADIDLVDIGMHLEDLCDRFDVPAIGYDPSYFWNAPQLEKDGLPMLEIPPSSARMAPICGHAYGFVRAGQLTHDGQEQFTLHVLAGKRRYGQNGFTIEKRNYANKCDAAIALCLMISIADDPDPTPDPAQLSELLTF